MNDLQTVLFDAKLWTVTTARNWLRKHKLRYDDIDIKQNFIRFRQKEPNKRYKYFTMTLNNGVRLVFAK